MAQKQTELKKAAQGDTDKLSEKQAKGALSQAMARIQALSRKADASKEAMIQTGTRALHTAENQASLLLASMAEGYLGTEKMKVGGIDLRAPVGLLAQGYGLYEAMSCRTGGGDHALAVGNGITGSWLASVGVQAGEALAERQGRKPGKPKDVPSSSSAQPAAPSLQGSGFQGTWGAPALPTGGQGRFSGPVVQVPAMPARQYAPPALSGPAPQHEMLRAEAAASSYPRVDLIPEPAPRVSGPLREVRLTPEVRPETARQETVAGPTRPRPALRRAAIANRFPRAASETEEDAAEDEG